jgi:protein TonB
VQSDLIATEAVDEVTGAPAPPVTPDRPEWLVLKALRRGLERRSALVIAGVAGLLVAFTLGRGSANDEPRAPSGVRVTEEAVLVPVPRFEPVARPTVPAARPSPSQDVAAAAPPQPVASPPPSAPAAPVAEPARAVKAGASAPLARAPAPKSEREPGRAAPEEASADPIPARISEGVKEVAPAPIVEALPAQPVLAVEARAESAAARADEPPTPVALPAPARFPAAELEAADPNAVLPFVAAMNRPRRLSGRDPLYTPQALTVKSQGTMIVRCVIEVDGRATGCRVLKSVPGMDEAVLAAFATHRYSPIIYKGQPARVSYTFNFRLELP